ncbi:MAG TPA: nickel pincer cofactor biosynthesis protein LarC [Mycobacteriales bacterium]|nr:nickel pincer cofactor biosynthesis protein LarC [Mycobacteriales bacterium]
MGEPIPRVGWLDCASGISGDMLLGALYELGALERLAPLVESLTDIGVQFTPSATTRHGIAATAIAVTAAAEQPVRGLDDVLAIAGRAAMPAPARERAIAVFRRLAAAEGAVHGIDPGSVHFHEVGAVDSVVDVLAGCLGLHALGLDAIVSSPVALGGGTVQTEHGTLPVPVPAVLALLEGSGIASYGGPVAAELATPTGVAMLTEWATAHGPMPLMSVEGIGTGAGGRDLPDRANVLRFVVGTAASSADPDRTGWRVVEANVDDLDPRVWPLVLEHLLAAGAADAWLTPILMKKGRPAHTVSALVATETEAAIGAVLLRETSTIGLRSSPVDKRALERTWITVDVGGRPVRVKLAHDGGRRVNLSPEFDDVTAAATALQRPAKDVLAEAAALARQSLDG